MITSILPSIVRNRVLPLSLGGLTTGTKSESNISEFITPATPPPEYSPTPAGDYINTSDGETKASAATEASNVSETDQGINWKYANQGLSLLTQASNESKFQSENGDASSVLTRQLYLHGVSHLLRGIPTDLTPKELRTLRSATQESISNLQNDPNEKTTTPLSQQIFTLQLVDDASVLQRIIAFVIYYSFLLIQILLPYITVLLGYAYRWERKHKVAQHIVKKGLTVVDGLGRRSLQISRAVCQINGGKVGQAVNDFTIWWVQALIGGIQQGVSEGVAMDRE